MLWFSPDPKGGDCCIVLSLRRQGPSAGTSQSAGISCSVSGSFRVGSQLAGQNHGVYLPVLCTQYVHVYTCSVASPFPTTPTFPCRAPAGQASNRAAPAGRAEHVKSEAHSRSFHVVSSRATRHRQLHDPEEYTSMSRSSASERRETRGTTSFLTFMQLPTCSTEGGNSFRE